jgi:hypothetical protein
MKPSFALNLTDEGVTLLHRTARGWLDLGHVAFSEPDLPAALDYLRNKALGLAPKGLSTKVVIPNSQILYLELAASSPDPEEMRAQIAAQLDGRTPYDVAELAFCWSGTGPLVQVAAVAKETLAEAEGFAAEHRFNPVSFVAIAGDRFAGEPFFGTAAATSEKVEPDSEPVVIVAQELAKSAVAPEPVAVEVPKDPEPAPDLLPEPEPAPVAAPTAQAMPAPEAEPEPAPKPEPMPEPPLADPMPQPEPVSPPPPAPQISPLADPPPAPVKPPLPPFVSQDPAPAKAPEARPKMNATRQMPPPLAEADEAPMAFDVAPDDDPIPPMPAGRRPSITAPSVPAAADDLPPAPSSAAMMAFASRRAGEVPPPPTRATPASGSEARLRGPTDNSAAPPALGSPAAPKLPSASKPMVERPAAARPAPKFSYDDPVPPPPRLPGDPPVAAVQPSVKNGKLKSLTGLVTAPNIAGTKKKKPALNGAAPVPQVVTALGSEDRDADLTVSPAVAASTMARTNPVKPDVLARGLGSRAAPVRGKPRYLGLILTGILLMMLALVAAWSSYYLAGGFSTTPPATESADAEAAVPSAEDEIAADGQDGDFTDEAAADGQDNVDAAASVQPDQVDVPADEIVAAPAPVDPIVAEADPVLPPETTVDGTETQAAAVEPAPQTGVDSTVAEASQNATGAQDEIFLAGTDQPPTLSDPVTLTPPQAAGDAQPGPQMPPPPFGTVYKFDENGLIKPTKDGIVTPEGVTLVAGKPPVAPPVRPARFSSAAPPPTSAPAEGATAAAATSTTDGALTPDDTFAADPALAKARPKLRPEGLAPAASAGGEDGASLAPAEGSRFASLRPRARPQTVLAAGAELQRASDAASIAAQAAAAAAVAEVVANNASGSSLAVAVSRVPAPRPRDLSRAVEAAVAAATQQQPTARRNAPAASIAAAPSNNATAEEGDSEPEVASVAPKIPTRANVAKQATFANAINLSKTNLIGVYGSQSNRYALVRQSNGRYKKIKVGDSVDGGRVQAITANEVRYQKGGRLLSLGMPKT